VRNVSAIRSIIGLLLSDFLDFRYDELAEAFLDYGWRIPL
jgi:hypothetical protein